MHILKLKRPVYFFILNRCRLVINLFGYSNFLMIQIVQDDMIFRVKNSGLLSTIVVDVQYIKKIIINLLSGRTPQLCSPLTAMLNRPTTHPKKTDLYTWYPPNTIYIFEQHILLSIKRDQKNNIKTTKKKKFFRFF